MIRMIESRSGDQAKAYFSDALSKSDYYVSDQELAGVWQGRLAARLGLSGITDKEAFFALCENRNPATKGNLTPMTRADRRAGYDINFHCPKSVSLLHAFAGDTHILDAFRDSVTETMQAIEADAKTRVRKAGKDEDRATGELAYAHFIHQTARPVADLLPDPHLHSHCFVFNATWDETEGRVKAGQFGDIKRDMPYYQARFHKTLADKLTVLGYRIRRTAKSFEVEGVPQHAVDLFSKRTDEIGRMAKEKGITDAKELDALGARTRSKKQKGTGMEELRAAWRKQVRSLGKGNVDDKPVRFASAQEAVTLTAAQCLDHALLHCFERASVMDDRRLLETAYRHALGCSQVKLDEITSAFITDRRIIHIQEKARRVCTTRNVLLEEKRMVELARQGQGKMKPLYGVTPELTVSGQQAAAVAHVLTTKNRVSIIRGAAGAGKTTLMREAFRHITAAGKKMTVVAPSADASRGVLRSEGFAQAETVAKLLVDEKMQDGLKGQVLWVDEAGLLGTKDMTALLEIATAQNAQLILGGDTRQHAAVVRGDALRILNTVGKIKSAEVNKIYRQQNADYRAAVEDLSQGKVKEGFAKLEQIHAIKSVDPLKPNQQLVDDYMEAAKRGKEVLIVCPTHAQGDEVTDEIRARLRKEKKIGKKEIKAEKLSSMNFTEAQRADTRNFQPGQVVQFSQNAPGFRRGSQWTVESANEKEVRVRDAEGKSQKLPSDLSSRYEVYTKKSIRLSKGDKVRITRGSFDAEKKRLENGQILEVAAVSRRGKITLKNKDGNTFNLDKDFGHIAHAHCITSNASQGKTVQQVFIYQPAATFPATDAKQFYVSVSRGKEEVRVYTDDKEALLQHASALGERRSALELVEGEKKKKSKHKQADDVQRRKRQERQPALQQEYNGKLKQRKDHEPER